MTLILKCSPPEAISIESFRSSRVWVRDCEPTAGDPIFVWTSETQGGFGLQFSGIILPPLLFEARAGKQFAEIEFQRTAIVQRAFTQANLRPYDRRRSPQDNGPLPTLCDLLLVNSHNKITLLNEEQVQYLEDYFLLTDDLAGPNDVAALTLRSIGEQAYRPDQQRFRDLILRNYNRRGAITGSRTAAALEAAHIRVEPGADDNDPSNGILLRRDIHALFDALLITLRPGSDGLSIELSPRLTDPMYEFLRDTPVSTPADGPVPTPSRIQHHRERFLAAGAITEGERT